jgi:hypothetical protein
MDVILEIQKKEKRKNKMSHFILKVCEFLG